MSLVIHSTSYTPAVHLNTGGGEGGSGGGRGDGGRGGEQDMPVKRLESVRGRDSGAHF